MTNAANAIINQALELSSSERADVAEKLLLSLDEPDPCIDKIWSKEADARIEAYERGEIEAVSVEEVFKKYQE
ncbi:MAG: addiction module protein [Alcanivoracaceae bacterium]|nr:addiction module protein [Alcanivoracaceae bacterium]